MARLSPIVGLHAVQSVLTHQPERVQRLCLLQERQDKKIEAIIALAEANHVRVELLSRQAFEKLVQDEMHHQGVIAFCETQQVYSEADLPAFLEKITSPFFLVLDGVQDPHNLGACFRSADAAGVAAIIAPKDKAVGITPVVSKVASGAAEVVPFFQVTNLVRTLERLKEHNIWIYGAAHDAPQTLYQADLRGNVAMVLGAEGSGLRRLTREHCDVLIRIPMFGTVSSLNVSVAAGVCLFEVVRQKEMNTK